MKKIFIFGLIMLIALSGLVMASERNPPMSLSGAVTTNGVAAEDNLLIVARIDGVDVASTITSGGNYGLSPNFLRVPDDAAGRDGETIYLFVKDKSDVYISGPSVIFMHGGVITGLNIAVNGDFTDPVTPPPKKSSGGGGGGGGGYVPLTTDAPEDTNLTDIVDPEEDDSNACEADWSCTAWLDCIAGTQKRTCVDDNSCEAGNNVKVEEQDCEILTMEESLEEEEKGQRGFFGNITGAVLGGGAGSWIGLGILLLILGGVLAYYFYNKNNKSKKTKKSKK